ncbi:hypothetical protein [Streptomyces sp. NL15-2K]|uniref:hypothetical protein n=1 Tax=Streptomyces sp. NL15-2K TaxID=376149 RepID=UPI00209BD256|nr:hypothetical protein [Streptomyces sp. NL15-2K]
MHQRAFALQGGADVVSATLWPLSVDGLLLLATVGLLNSSRNAGPCNVCCGVAGLPPRDRGVVGGECGGRSGAGMTADAVGGLAPGSPCCCRRSCLCTVPPVASTARVRMIRRSLATRLGETAAHTGTGRRGEGSGRS